MVMSNLRKAVDTMANAEPPFRPEPGQELSDDDYLREIGLTGLERSGGDVLEEWKPELKGKEAIRVWREMTDNDAIVGAIFHSIQMLIRQVNWEPQPFDDSPQARENAQFLEECMHDMSMPWPDTISEIVSMLVYGFSYHEVVYKKRQGPDEEDASLRSRFTDGKIGWRKMPIRIRGMWQMPPPDYQRRFIPIEKSLLFRTEVTKNNPQGKSILRNAYRSYIFKKRFEELEGIGIERDLAGMPMAYVDPKIMSSTASPEDKAIYEAIKNKVVNIRRDQQEGIVFPRIFDDRGNQLYDLVLLSTGGARQYNTQEIIDRYDRRMAQSVLADFIMMGHETVGSFALSSSKTRLFAVALGAWLDMISGVFNNVAISRLFKLNGINDNLPSIVHTDLEIPDLAEIADFIAKLAGVGIILDDDETENHLRRVAKLPKRSLAEQSVRSEIREAREQQTLATLQSNLNGDMNGDTGEENQQPPRRSSSPVNRPAEQSANGSGV